MENYLLILEESLNKKIAVLQKIEAENKKQEAILKEDDVVMEELDESFDRKGELIEELNRLDQGFENLYDRIKEQLLKNREQYKQQIGVLQQLISRITDISVSIQAQESRNKRAVEKYFADTRQKIQTGRQNSKAAFDYYNRMSGSGSTVAPRFMDKKQ